jgi:hypothetical protein
MKRRHALVVSLFAAIAVAAGVLAVVRSSAGSATSGTSTVSNAQIAAQQRRLDRWEAALRKARAKRPPKLPPLTGAANGAAATVAPRIVYVYAPAQGSATAASHDDGREIEAEHGEQEGSGD